jgi:pimeloyl-ACP methyl ester carboxylesterase
LAGKIMRAGRVLVLLACSALTSFSPIAAQEEASEKDIKTALASPDSFLRNKTWSRLNPEKDSHYKYIVQILRTLSWYDRQGAILALAKAATEDTLKKIVRDLKENKDPAVRQGMADALAKMNDEKFYPALYEALKDKDPEVRRMVAFYLRVHKKKDAVQALVDLLQQEADPVVRSFVIDSLNSLTQAFQGTDPRAWSLWWEAAKLDKDYTLGKTDAQAIAKAEELGNKLKKRTTVSMIGGVEIESEERGGKPNVVSVPVLVIPEYGFSKEIMKPFFSELEKTNKIFYIDLPEISKFKNLKTLGAANIPYYPIDQLVDAFEDLRKATKQERFALMACGMNCWIAMRYAAKYPKSISHLVLISPYSSNKLYGDALDRLERQGQAKNDIEMWHYALSQRVNTESGENMHDIYHTEKKIPKPEGENGGLDRRHWSLHFKDERDSLIGMLYPIKNRWLGNVAIPDFRCFSQPPQKIPTIVIRGKADFMGSLDDCKAIAKHFGGPVGVCYEYPNSSRMPFAEESTLFNKHMAFLLREKGSASKAKAKAAAKAAPPAKGGTTVPAGQDDPAKAEAKDPKDSTGEKEKPGGDAPSSEGAK